MPPEGATPRSPLLLAALGIVLLVAGIGLIATGKPRPGGPVAAVGLLLAGLGWLARRKLAPVARRPLRAGLALYMLLPLTLAIGAAATSLPSPAPTPRQQQEQAKATAEQRRNVARDEAALASPRISEGIKARYVMLQKSIGMIPILGTMALGVFLVGGWLVGSGAIADPAGHARMWKGLALAWPLWAALAAAALWLSPSWPLDASPPSPRNLAGAALATAAALPMSLGYMAMLVLGLRTRVGEAVLAILAPAGRMALTNYLMQSLVCAFVFYGWGLHQWGMPRHQQVGFVFALYAGQLLLSAAWLRAFRYGSMEWLWRWLTYGQRPGLLRQPAAPALQPTGA